jgi:hypothetical protein
LQAQSAAASDFDVNSFYESSFLADDGTSGSQPEASSESKVGFLSSAASSESKVGFLSSA